jgi:TPR repeat protein
MRSSLIIWLIAGILAVGCLGGEEKTEFSFDLGPRGNLLAKCGEDDIDACTELAQDYERGTSGPVDLDAARKLYDGACEKGAATACVNLGVMYSAGKGVAVDHTEANRLFQRVCDLGKGGSKGAGCYNLWAAQRGFFEMGSVSRSVSEIQFTKYKLFWDAVLTC